MKHEKRSSLTSFWMSSTVARSAISTTRLCLHISKHTNWFLKEGPRQRKLVNDIQRPVALSKKAWQKVPFILSQNVSNLIRGFPQKIWNPNLGKSSPRRRQRDKIMILKIKNKTFGTFNISFTMKKPTRARRGCAAEDQSALSGLRNYIRTFWSLLSVYLQQVYALALYCFSKWPAVFW